MIRCYVLDNVNQGAVMNKLIIAITIALSSAFSMPLQAKAPTKVVFAKGSYCGSFTGNVRHGRTFRLGLLANQDFIITNTGDGQINVASVKGPNGIIRGSRIGNAKGYYISKSGPHDILIYANSNHSSIEFCAYSR